MQFRELSAYQQASILHEYGIHLVSSDEMTGIQALERLHPTSPMASGKLERQEFEYERHGVRALIASLEVALGTLITPTIGLTLTETDFASHIENVVQTHPNDIWIFILDQLNTHKSESLVRLIAKHCDKWVGKINYREKSLKPPEYLNPVCKRHCPGTYAIDSLSSSTAFPKK